MKAIKELFTKQNMIVFVAIVVGLVVLELVGYGVGANAERVRQLRAGGGV